MSMINHVYIHHPVGIPSSHVGPQGEGIMHLAFRPQSFGLVNEIEKLLDRNPDLTVEHIYHAVKA